MRHHPRLLGLVVAGALTALIDTQSVGAVVFTVNSTADAVDANPGDGVCADAAGRCTLRAAVMEANATFGRDTIVLPAGIYVLTIPGAGEDASATGDLDVKNDLAIDGAGAASTIIDGGGLDRVSTSILEVWRSTRSPSATATPAPAPPVAGSALPPTV